MFNNCFYVNTSECDVQFLFLQRKISNGKERERVCVCVCVCVVLYFVFSLSRGKWLTNSTSLVYCSMHLSIWYILTKDHNKKTTLNVGYFLLKLQKKTISIWRERLIIQKFIHLSLLSFRHICSVFVDYLSQNFLYILSLNLGKYHTNVQNWEEVEKRMYLDRDLPGSFDQCSPQISPKVFLFDRHLVDY